MRFAFAGFDRWRSVFDNFVAAGWEPAAVFTMPLDNRHDYHQETVALANQHKIPVQLSRIREKDLQALRDDGCDALVVAGYHWRVPDWTPYLKHAINFHPAPLPEGRGPYPLMQAIVDQHTQWGASCHRIANDFDTGEILANESFDLQADECLETLQLKLQMATKRLSARVANNFSNLWAERRDQIGGSYWPRLTEAQTTLDFDQPVDDILRVVRACGLVECVASMNGTKVFVKRAVGWRETHTFTPGEIVHEHHRSIVMAARDGFIGLIEWSPLYRSLREKMGP